MIFLAPAQIAISRPSTAAISTIPPSGVFLYGTSAFTQAPVIQLAIFGVETTVFSATMALLLAFILELLLSFSIFVVLLPLLSLRLFLLLGLLLRFPIFEILQLFEDVQDIVKVITVLSSMECEIPGPTG